MSVLLTITNLLQHLTYISSIYNELQENQPKESSTHICCYNCKLQTEALFLFVLKMKQRNGFLTTRTSALRYRELFKQKHITRRRKIIQFS